MGTLREFIEAASGPAETIFQARGRMLPMYHIVYPGGEVAIPAPPAPKDESVAFMRFLLEQMQATRVLYIDEAWTAEARGETAADALQSYADNNSLENYPGRVERVIFMAEDIREGALMGVRNITRDGDKASLDPLQILDLGNLSGRMVGLLPHTGAEH